MAPGREILALDLGGTKLSAAVADGAAVHDRREVPTPAAEGPEAVLRAAAALVAPLLAGRSAGTILAVAATGRVERGCVSGVNQGTMPGWEAFPLAQRLAQETGAEVTVVNDAHAATWGEYRHGAGAGLRDFAFVTVSTGLGAGFVVDGRLARGAHGLAGHLGFWRDTDPAARGAPYLERRASGRALGEAATRRLGRPLDARGVLAAAERGDAAASEVVDDVVHAIATALIDLQLLVDPKCIAVGGGLGLASGFLARLCGAVDALGGQISPRLVPARLGPDAGLLGAAALASRGADDFGADD